MAYVKPNTFVTSTALNASDIVGNDEALKIFLNQQSLTADLAVDAFDTQEIQLGEYQPITNEYTFATGIDTGKAVGTEKEDRAYFTSNIKKNRSTDPNLYIWTSSYHTGPHLTLERTADILITWGGTYISNSNTNSSPAVGSGFWDSQVKLGYVVDDGSALTFVEQSRSYSFEECAMTNTVSGLVDPFGAMSKPSSAGDETAAGTDPITKGLRRWIGWSCILRNMPAGTYKFSHYINAKVVQGFTSARNFKAEVFYK